MVITIMLLSAIRAPGRLDKLEKMDGATNGRSDYYKEELA